MPDSSSPSAAHPPAALGRPKDGAACQAALLTPPGRGAVATVLVAGPGSSDAVAPFFQTARGRTVDFFPNYRIIYGNWRRRPTETAAGRHASAIRTEDVVLVRHGPDRIEIHCHGGALAADSILDDLAAGGCRRMSGIDWLAQSQHSPLAGQAMRQLVEARTLRTAAVLLDQAQGALEKSLRTIVRDLQEQRSIAARQGLAELCAHARTGLHLVRPWRVALSGPPNVGKSSLINALVGYERAIVYEQPGTTRDVVRVATALDGWPIELSDTAGVRDPRDAVEREGIRRARRTFREADLVLLIHDTTQPMVVGADESSAADPSRLLHVRNKINLAKPRAAELAQADCLTTSALTGQGIPELISAIVERLVGVPPAAGAAVPFTRQQVAILQQAIDRCDHQQPAAAAVRLCRLLGAS